MSGFASYDDVYGPRGMADDRDDSADPEFRAPDGYCEHGTYVGGCAADYMCGWCEDGISAAEARHIVQARRTRETRARAERAARLLHDLLRHGMGGIDAAYFAQESSYVANPLSRYGRH
jgi:hypothetical protein